MIRTSNPYQLRRRWMDDVCRRPELPCSAKIVAYRIAEYWNTKQHEAFPSLARLADDLVLSKRTVQRAINDLCEAGLLHKLPPRRGRASNTYRLSVRGGKFLKQGDSVRKRKANDRADEFRPSSGKQAWMNSVAQALGGGGEGYAILQQLSATQFEMIGRLSEEEGWNATQAAKYIVDQISDR